MSLLLHLVGLVVFVAGLGWIATLAGVAQAYIVAVAAFVLGLGIFTALAARGRS